MFALVIAAEVALMLDWQLSGSDRAPSGSVRDTLLSRSGLELYAPPIGTSRARAIVVFFGDASCWRPYRRLASSLANDGYAVIAVGPHVMRTLTIADDSAAMQSASDTVAAVVDRGLMQIRAGRASPAGSPPIPVVLMGHGHGATSAIWVANHVAIAGLRGVVTLSPPDALQSRATKTRIVTAAEWHVGPDLRVTVPDRHTHIGTADVSVASIEGSLGPHGLFAPSRRLNASHVTFTVPFSTTRLTSPFLTGLAVRRSLDWILVPQ